MNTIVIVSFLIAFIFGWLSHSMVVASLRTKYPKIYIDEGEPIHFWNGLSTWSFWMSFIILRKFSKLELDQRTKIWCNLLFFTLLYWNAGIIIYLIYQVKLTT